jgi:endonuclease/exonuclease/phosphatase family metal-dependent hydrolase
VDSVGTSGGLVSAWNPNFFTLAASLPSQHVLSLDLTINDNGATFRFSNVYAPCEHHAKAAFLEHLLTHEPDDGVPWLVAGDFNLTRDPADRNNDNFSAAEAELFNNAINDLGLIELPLRDRLYTWSNKRAVPTLVRLDRVFINHA